MIYKLLIIFLIALNLFIGISEGGNGIRKAFLLWILTLALGYRAVEVTTSLKIHPSELILWILFILLVVQQHSDTHIFRFPKFSIVLIPFFIWGCVIGSLHGLELDVIVSELKNFLLLFPLFSLASFVLVDERNWISTLMGFYITATFIAFTGLLEYCFPGIFSFLFGSASLTNAMITGEGFYRASFSLWGSPSATFTCVLALPMYFFLRTKYQQKSKLWIINFSFLLLLGGIYIGGYRSMWFLTLIILSIYVWLKFGFFKSTLLLFALTSILVFSAPKVTVERFSSVYMTYKGENPADTSSLKRFNLARQAMRAMAEHPMGLGWSGVGWVHTDFLQLSANLGVAAGLIFLSWYLNTLKELWKKFLSQRKAKLYDALGVSLLMSFLGAGGILAVEGVQVLPQLILPIWLVWSFCEVYLKEERMTA